MLGGGTFVSMTKKLPGSYINFVSAARANSQLGERGYVAMPVELDWGVDGEVFTVTAEDFFKNCRVLFGYEYTHSKMKPLRDLFLHAETVYFYKLGTGVKATSDYATAKYAGTRGNDLKIVIVANEDDSSKYDVKTYLGTTLIDTQTVADSTELVANDFMEFKEFELTETASTPLTGGTKGQITATEWTTALTALESYSFNVIGVVSTDDAIKRLVATWTKDMREKRGIKFQAVVYNLPFDHEGVINLVSHPKDKVDSADLVYWVAGKEAACKVNASCVNAVYDGEFDVDVNVTQQRLEEAIDNGELIMHKVGDDVRILLDINSLVTTTETKGDDFKQNQVIRVIDELANGDAALFNEQFLGVIPNDEQGRISLWNQLVSRRQYLQQIRAIQNYEPEHTTITKGDKKTDVVIGDQIEPTCAMERMYLTCVIN